MEDANYFNLLDLKIICYKATMHNVIQCILYRMVSIKNTVMIKQMLTVCVTPVGHTNESYESKRRTISNLSLNNYFIAD